MVFGVYIEGMEERINTGVRLLPATVKALDDAADRMGGKSRAFVVEVLVALHAAELGPKTTVPVSLMPSNTRAKKKPKK